MNKPSLILILTFLIFQLHLYGQDSISVGEEIVIHETITTINKTDLFAGWKEMAEDTINPTSIMVDLNGDKKLDMIGFFTGIENGLFVFGNVEGNDGEIEQLYKLEFDSTWFEQTKFQAILTLINAGEKIQMIETEKSQILSQNSALIMKRDGSKFVLTFLNNNWQLIKIE